MRRHRYLVRLTYGDGTPGISFQTTLAAARAVAYAAEHGGRPIAAAEVLERLSSGAEVPTRVPARQ